MKHITLFEQFINEAKNSSDFSVLSIGTLNINTGKSKFFNVYDEWSDEDKTVEIYQETKPTRGMINLVITSGTKPISNKNGKDPVEGDERSFANDQNGRPIFTGNFLGSISLKDLKSTDFFKKLGMNSDAFRAYVYK